jgi:hypothetical protein
MGKPKNMRYYDIHGIVRACSNRAWFPDYFLTEPTSNVDLVINKGNFAHKQIEGQFFGGNGELYTDISYFGLPVRKMLLKDLMGKTELYFTELTDRFFYHAISCLIWVLVEIKLLQRECTFVHAAGISRSGKAHVIAGWTMMGKSSTIFGLARHGVKILGDDVVIISKNGMVYPFPEKVGLGTDTANVRLSVRQKIEVNLRHSLHRLTSISPILRALFPIESTASVDLSKIAKIGGKAKLDKTFILSKGKKTERIDKTAAINRIVASTLHAMMSPGVTREIFMAYCYFNDFDPNYIETKMRDILHQSLKECIVLGSKKKKYYRSILSEISE